MSAGATHAEADPERILDVLGPAAETLAAER